MISLGLAMEELTLRLPTSLVEHWWFSLPCSERPAFPLICEALISLTTLHICWMQLTLAVGAGMTGQGPRDGTNGEAPCGKPWVAEPGQGLIHSSFSAWGTGALLQQFSLNHAR